MANLKDKQREQYENFTKEMDTINADPVTTNIDDLKRKINKYNEVKGNIASKC